MQRVFRVVETKALTPVGPKATNALNRSVRRYGVLNPVLLAEVVDADGVMDLDIIDGNRRIRAARSMRLPKVPAVVLKATTEQDRARLTLVCNYMRSANFHTESEAILSLATDEEAAAGAARTIGLGPAKMQQLYRKIATMPEPVRQAMYDHRIPVSAATGVGAGPEGLQRELIELLGRRRYVNTTMVRDLREWYAERHPEAFARAEPAKGDVPFDEWSDTSLHVVDIPAPAIVPEETPPPEPERASSTGSALSHVPGPSLVDRVASIRAPETIRSDPEPADAHAVAPVLAGRSAPSQAVAPARDRAPGVPEPIAHAGPLATAADRGDTHGGGAGAHHSDSGPTGTMEDRADPGPRDDRVERMVAFVVRLDGTLRELAREGHAIGIDRSVWVDRAMRAWDGIGG